MLYTFDSISPVAFNEMSDEQLMRSVVDQDTGAFEEMHRRYASMLKTQVARVLHDEFIAEDVVQEIFVDLWTSADRYSEAKGKVIGWLMTIARRRAIDRLRKFQCRQRAEDRLENDMEKQPASWTHTRIESDIESAEMQRLLSTLMAKLPEAQRKAVEWAYLQGMSQREIAQKMQIPLGTIKTRLDLAVRKLSGALREVLNDTTGARLAA